VIYLKEIAAQYIKRTGHVNTLGSVTKFLTSIWQDIEPYLKATGSTIKTMTVGDVHGREVVSKIRPIIDYFDKIIFIGDYMDSFIYILIR